LAKGFPDIVEPLALVGVRDFSLPISSQSPKSVSFRPRSTSDNDGFLLAFEGRILTIGGDVGELEEEGEITAWEGKIFFLALNHFRTPSLL
jgi:hypothetical protein